MGGWGDARRGEGRLRICSIFSGGGEGKKEKDLLNTITGAFIMAARALLCFSSCCWLPMVLCRVQEMRAEAKKRGPTKERSKHDDGRRWWAFALLQN